MSRLTPLLLALVAGCSGSSTPQEDKGQKDTPENKLPPVRIKSDHDYTGWKQSTLKEVGFEVWFPSDPKASEARSGEKIIHTLNLQRRDVDSLHYSCSWLLLAKPYNSRAGEEAYLQGQQAGAVLAAKGKLIDEKPIRLNGVPGREFTIKVDSQNILRCRVVIFGEAVVNLSVVGKAQEALQSTDAVKFLDSPKIKR